MDATRTPKQPEQVCEEAQTSQERTGGTGRLALQKAGAVVLEQDMGVCPLQGENLSYKRGAEGAELEKRRIHMVTNTPFPVRCTDSRMFF